MNPDAPWGTELWAQPRTRRRILGQLAGVCCGVALSGCSLTGDNESSSTSKESEFEPADWAMFGGDAANSRALPGSTGPSEPVEVRWRFDDATDLTWPSAATSETLFVSSVPDLFALETRSGAERWRFEPSSGSRPFATAVSNEFVYVGMAGSDGTMHALDRQTGEVRWEGSVSNAGGVVGAALIGGKVIVVGDSGRVVAFDAVSGDKRWRFDAPGANMFSPAAAGKTVYVGGQDTNVYAIDALTAEERWRFTESRFDTAPPCVWDETVFVANRRGFLFALDRATGETQWRAPFTYGRKSLPSPPVASGDVVYVSSLENTVFAFDATTGVELWQFEFENPVLAEPFWPALAGDTLYASSGNQQVYALDSETGEQRWRYELADGWVTNTLVIGETLYVGSQRGSNAVYALT